MNARGNLRHDWAVETTATHARGSETRAADAGLVVVALVGGVLESMSYGLARRPGRYLRVIAVALG